jgi:hypothetical protein
MDFGNTELVVKYQITAELYSLGIPNIGTVPYGHVPSRMS